MKTQFITILLACCICLLSACSGDHASQNGKDTGVNSYHAKDTSKVDTSKVTSADNSATGGAGNTKDTAKTKK